MLRNRILVRSTYWPNQPIGILRVHTPQVLYQAAPIYTSVRTMGSVSRVKSLDHLVLTVRDLEATVKFYENVLGMKHTSFQSGTSSELRHALGKSKVI